MPLSQCGCRVHRRRPHHRPRRDEIFYGLTILASNSRQALSDFTADDIGPNLGFETGAVLLAGLIVLVAATPKLAPPGAGFS